MPNTLTGQVTINGTDLWTGFHAFLREEKRGSRENLDALLAPANSKSHVPVNIREEQGERYSADLTPRSEGRDVTLHFAVYAPTAALFVNRYRTFIAALKNGDRGWLIFRFPTLDLTMRMYAKEFPGGFTAISDLWNGTEQCGAFKVTFREPVSSF